MPILSPTRLAHLADWITKNVLVDTGDILRETREAAPSGGFVITYPVAHAAVSCAVIGIGRPGEALIAGQEVAFTPQYILLPKGIDILGSDRIKVRNFTYHVIDFDDPTYEVVQKVLVRRSSLVG